MWNGGRRRSANSGVSVGAFGVPPDVQAQDDILVVIAETLAEDVHSTRMLGTLVDADPQAYRMVLGEVKLI